MEIDKGRQGRTGKPQKRNIGVLLRRNDPVSNEETPMGKRIERVEEAKQGDGSCTK